MNTLAPRSGATPGSALWVLKTWRNPLICCRGYRPKATGFRPALAERSSAGRQLSPLSEVPILKPKDWIIPSSGRLPPVYPNINSLSVAAKCVAHLDPKFYKDTTVIEVNPGPGIFTRALFNQINPKNYVLFDSQLTYKPCLAPLVVASNGVIKHYDLDGWDFKSYSETIRRGIITPEAQDRSKIHSSLLFVGNFTETDLKRADGFVAQLLSFMYNNLFFYQFGRVKTLIWMQSPGWHALVAPQGSEWRKKVTIVRGAVCDARLIAQGPRMLHRMGNRKLSYFNFEEQSEEVIAIEGRRFHPNASAALIELTPFAENKANVPWEEFEYLALKLNTVGNTSLSKAIKVVAPGAEILLKSIEPYDPHLVPISMSKEQWFKLADAFHRWPFKPDVREDETYIDYGTVEDYRSTAMFPSPSLQGIFNEEEMDEMDDEYPDEDVEKV